MNAITKGGYQDVPMTRRRAQLLEEYASKLADMLEAAPNDKDLAEWVQSKIDRAAAAIQSAYHYLDQDDESELEKARVLKYDYRRPSKTRFNKKTGKREWDYFYTKKHGARVTRGAFEAGAAFRMTWKGRKGHFHIHHVKGDQVFITHDSRPDMEPISVQADELRALLERQHKREVDQHLKRKTRKVEEIKRRAHRGGLGLALHRLRQAAAQAGVSLPEQYQRKPKKTRAKVAETAREAETAPRSKTPAPKTRAGLARLIHQELLSAGFKGANLWIKNEGTDREKARVYLSGKGRKQGMIEALSSQEYGSEGAFRLQVIQEEGLESASEEEIQAAIDRRSSALDLKLTPPKLDPEQLQRYLEAISAVARKLKDSAPKILDPSDRPTLALTLDYTETPLAQRSREELETLRTKAQQVNSGESRPQDRNENTHAVSVAQHIMREVNIALGETTAQTTQTTPRDQLTSTAQQIIEDANQEHAERHDEHQEITRFELGEHTHTKTGAKLYTAKQTERVERDEYFRRVAIAKKHGGRYERRYVRGFVFRSAEDARAFALEVEGAAPPETSAETVTPHDEHPSADNFETMPEVESARATTATVRDVQSTLKASRRADKLTSTGRRARASINADKELIEAAQRALDEGYRGMESPAFIPLNERTPRQANYQRLKGALNGFKSSQTLTRGSWTDDHKSLQKKRIKARDQLDEALKELDQIARSQEQAQVSIEDLPPKGQRTLEDAKRFFGEPKYFERIEGSKTKRYVIYERDGHRIVGPASGRGKGKFSRSFSWDTPRYRSEREQGNIIAGSDSLTYQEIGDYDTLDEALTRTINQYRSQDEMIDKLIEKEKERLAQGRKELERLSATPREQLTETAREVTQGADNFETMPEVESAPRQGAERRRKEALIRLRFRQLLSLQDQETTETLDVEENRLNELSSKLLRTTEEAEQKRIETQIQSLITEAREKVQRAEERAGEAAPEPAPDPAQAIISDLMNLESDEIKQVEEYIEGYKGERYKRAQKDLYIKELSKLLGDAIAYNYESLSERYSEQAIVQTLERLEDEKNKPDLDNALVSPLLDKQPAAPARQALTETAERVTSDQTAEQATTRATPRPSEATLRGSGELDETVRANLQDRAQYLLRMPEDTTKTGRRSKRQKARDGELLLIHRRLQSDAQERLGPTAPRFADYSQLIGMPRADQPENAETRAQFRAALKDAIRELEQATSGQVTKSAHPLITYRAQLIQTVERLTA